MPRVAVIPGDGIGPEVVAEAVRVLECAADRHGLELVLDEWEMGAERYLREGVTITEEEFRALAGDYDAILLGALGDPRVPDNVHIRDILLGLRFGLDLYVNYRPCPLLAPGVCPLREVPPDGIDLEIFRENTEGPYVNMGGTFKEGTPDEVAIQEDVNTWKGVERIVRAAFEHARERGRERVTLVDKANALPRAGALWRRVFRELGAEFPAIEREELLVDAAAMDLVRRPGELQVVVTSNLFGDILSDLAAQVTGGLGLAASANLHPGRHALFEPVHGSAPDIAGTGRANPLAAIRCAALLLEFLGRPDAAREVDEAVAASIAEGETTPDLAGDRSTTEVGAWIAGTLGAGAA
ncbi:MAG TPA: isocitrate/isopropylmalate dehydrogenase family protein [Longimicrobiales bacterium]|nr:isocitrate/isopropylmalate dehydrogenase family protein [Longimicrobiales bacterium]